MPCSITQGRDVSCKDAIGGIKGVYIHNFTEFYKAPTNFSVSNGEVTALVDWNEATDAEAKFNMFYFAVRREMCNLEVSINSDPANGTTFFEQRFTMDLNKLTQEDANTMRLLAYGRPQIIVEDNQGNLLMLGAKNGMDVSSGSISTGQSFGDRNGVSLEFTGRETEAFWTLVGTPNQGTPAEAPFQNFNSAHVTIDGTDLATI